MVEGLVFFFGVGFGVEDFFWGVWHFWVGDFGGLGQGVFCKWLDHRQV